MELREENFLSPSFPIQNGILNFALEYTIKKILFMTGTHLLMAYVIDVNLTGDYIGTIQRNADMLLNAQKNIHVSVHTWKTEYMEVERHR